MSHIYCELYYHIIWGTKRRNELIVEDLETILRKTILFKIKQLECQLLEFNSVLDHCHLLASILPKINISDFVGQIKGYSSHEVNKIKGDKYLKWQQGFGVLSLSKKGVPFVKQYIRNQKQHHRNNTLIDVMEFSSES